MMVRHVKLFKTIKIFIHLIYLKGHSFVYERLCFLVEWFQVEAGLVRPFILNYFPYDKTVEMVKLHLFYEIIFENEYFTLNQISKHFSV